MLRSHASGQVGHLQVGFGKGRLQLQDVQGSGNSECGHPALTQHLIGEDQHYCPSAK